jgi:hypothetical protein
MAYLYKAHMLSKDIQLGKKRSALVTTLSYRTVSPAWIGGLGG